MMSYFSQAENTNISASSARAVTPMSVDFLALGDLYNAFEGYGTNNSFRGILFMASIQALMPVQALP